MSKILVTGGAGFIGSHLCKELIRRGETVYCLDNFYSGSYENIEALEFNKNFILLDWDVVNTISLKVDQIYNLACPASPVAYQKDPIYTSKISVLGALNMLELAKKNNCRILQASTSEVYGDPLEHPQREEYFGNVNPLGIRSCYDEGKRMVESLFMDYYREGLSIRIARIFNTYGPNMRADDGRVVSNFITQALSGIPITIYGSGFQTRSFCYVSDLIQGLIALMEGKEIGPINLGNPEEYKMTELARKIIKMTNSKSPVIFKGFPGDDPKRRKPDIEKAMTYLNWQPIIGLEIGLMRTIEYFKGENK